MRDHDGIREKVTVAFSKESILAAKMCPLDSIILVCEQGWEEWLAQRSKPGKTCNVSAGRGIHGKVKRV